MIWWRKGPTAPSKKFFYGPLALLALLALLLTWLLSGSNIRSVPSSYPALLGASHLQKLPVTLLRCFESCSAQTSRFPRDCVGCLSANVLPSHCQILALDLPERCPDFASLSYRVCLWNYFKDWGSDSTSPFFFSRSRCNVWDRHLVSGLSKIISIFFLFFRFGLMFKAFNLRCIFNCVFSI